MTLFVNRYCCY